MKTDLEEIAGLLAKAKIYCASVPEGDVRQFHAGQISMLCDAIGLEIDFAKLPGLPALSAAESAGRLTVSLAQLEEWLARAKAHELAQEVGRVRATRRTTSRVANDAKRENTESRTRQIAALWNHACKQHPDWYADAIGQQVRERAGVSQKTLERHLTLAREKGLIPKRHRRKP